MDFSNMRVLVCGDICLDIITEGTATRLSPEAPVPVVSNPTSSYSIGMAGNVAINLKNLGAHVDVLAYASSDIEGNIIKKLFTKNSINFETQKIVLDNEANTIVKNRILANGQQIIRIDVENSKESISKEVCYLLEDLNLECNNYDLIIISDYDKGFITKDTWKLLYEKLIKANKGNFFIDTKKKDVLNYYEGMILFPNTKEVKEMMAFNNVDTEHQLRVELDSDLLIETASENGAYGYSYHNSYHSKVSSKEVIDIVGAGDTFIAAFALYYTKFGNTQRSLDFANHCCGKVISKKGTASITLAEAIEYDYKNK